MVISARVGIVELGILAEHFEELGVRVRSKSQLIALVLEKCTQLLVEKGAILKMDMTPKEAQELFIRLGFEAPLLSKEEADRAELAEDTRSIDELVSVAVERVRNVSPRTSGPPIT